MAGKGAEAADSPVTPLMAGRLATPLGPMAAILDQAGRLVYLDFEDAGGPTPVPRGKEWRGTPIIWNHRAVQGVGAQIAEYFAGRRDRFELELAAAGNPFHQQVWAGLRAIPYGETISYGELARRVGRPGAARAVGRANGANPIAIIVPCHRVIGADGGLTGYSGGIERKAALLTLEVATAPDGQGLLQLGNAFAREYPQK